MWRVRRHCCCYLSAAAHAMQYTACACRTTCNVHFVTQHVAWTSKLRATGGAVPAVLARRLHCLSNWHAWAWRLSGACCMLYIAWSKPCVACRISRVSRQMRRDGPVCRDSRFAPRSHRAPQMDEHFLKHAGGRAAVEAALRGPANLALLAATVRPDGQAVRSAPRIRDRGVRDTVALVRLAAPLGCRRSSLAF